MYSCNNKIDIYIYLLMHPAENLIFTAAKSTNVYPFTIP